MVEPKFDEKFIDPNTGETVTRVKIAPDLLSEVDKHVTANTISANTFMQVSRQIVAFQIKQREEFDKATLAEQAIGKEVLRLREKLGLDSSWIYNLALKVMEKREPPVEEVPTK